MNYLINGFKFKFLDNLSWKITNYMCFKKFGNLVTLKSWDDLWLNEGFATWTEYLGANFSSPDWKDVKIVFLF